MELMEHLIRVATVREVGESSGEFRDEAVGGAQETKQVETRPNRKLCQDRGKCAHRVSV